MKSISCERSSMKTRRHHNNDGRWQIKTGKTFEQVNGMARRLGFDIPLPIRSYQDYVKRINSKKRKENDIDGRVNKVYVSAG